MIIWGSKVREVVESQGEFNCPECNTKTKYSAIKAKRYFTLYFIPLFPTSTVGEMIKCAQCNNYYKPEALEYRPPSEEEKALSDIKHELINGTPINMVKQKLINRGLQEETAIQLLAGLVGNNKKSCTTCKTEYISLVTVCSCCGADMG